MPSPQRTCIPKFRDVTRHSTRTLESVYHYLGRGFRGFRKLLNIVLAPKGKPVFYKSPKQEEDGTENHSLIPALPAIPNQECVGSEEFGNTPDTINRVLRNVVGTAS